MRSGVSDNCVANIYLFLDIQSNIVTYATQTSNIEHCPLLTEFFSECFHLNIFLLFQNTLFHGDHEWSQMIKFSYALFYLL